MNPQLTFVSRLRRERLRNGISLDDIATQNRIKVELLEAFENNDLTDWPRGLYARAWVRAYAVAVGLDPADTVDEFCRLYLHGDRRARSTIRELASITATDSEYRDDIGHEERRRGNAAQQHQKQSRPVACAAAFQLPTLMAKRNPAQADNGWARPDVDNVRAGLDINEIFHQ
jgi:transcriptional regulator with XRE-family HTH domain